MSIFTRLHLPRLPHREDTVFSILVFLTLIVPLAVTLNTYEHYEVIKFSLWLMILGWAVVAYLAKPLYYERLKLYKPFFSLLGLFWAWVLFSTAVSLDVHNSIFGFYPRFSSSLLFFTVWVLYMVLLAAVVTKEKIKVLFKVLAFDALLISVVGILQSYGIAFYDGPASGAFLRAPSLLGNPNFSTMFTVMLLPVTLVLFVQAKNLATRSYYGLVIFSILFSTVILSSRGSLMGLYLEMVVLLAGCLWMRKSAKLVVAALLAVMLAAGLNFVLFNLARPGSVAATVNMSDSNIRLRFLTWKTALKSIADDPVFGAGPGNFQITFERHRDQQLASDSGIFDDAHNVLLQVATTSGVPAMALFSLLGLWAAVAGWIDARKNSDPLVLSAAVGVVGFFAIGSFTPIAMPCFLLLAVLLLGSIHYRLKEETFAPVRTLRFSLLAAGVVLVVYGLLLIVSEHLFFKGYQEYKYAANPGTAYFYTGWAIRLNSTNQLFFIYHNRAAIALNESESEITAEIERFKALNPTSSYTYSRAATSYFFMYMKTKEKGYFDRAVQNMSQAFVWDPYYAARYGRLGYFYFSAGDYATAKEYVKTSLSLDEHYLPAWVLLAKIYQMEGNREETISALSRAFRERPEITDLRNMLKIAKSVKNIRQVPIPVMPQLEE